MVRVEPELRDGTTMVETVEAPRGSEDAFASEADVIAKFRKLAARRIPDSAVDRLVTQVMEAETLPSAAELVRSLAVRS